MNAVVVTGSRVNRENGPTARSRPRSARSGRVLFWRSTWSSLSTSATALDVIADDVTPRGGVHESLTSRRGDDRGDDVLDHPGLGPGRGGATPLRPTT
ncbi:MAG: hypothetical protein WKF75_15775 [Singulisphaera sp.]